MSEMLLNCFFNSNAKSGPLLVSMLNDRVIGHTYRNFEI